MTNLPILKEIAETSDRIGQHIKHGVNILGDTYKHFFKDVLGKNFIKFITGFGDYKIQSNSLMGIGLNPPEIINKSRNFVVLRHREYIADIFGTTNFTVQSFPINPGVSSTFPWLSGVASNYEQYFFTGMIFEYKSLSADYTNAPAMGTVIMATSYNAQNFAFPDKRTMQNYEYANSNLPSNTFIHPIECARDLNPVSELYTRSGSFPSGADPRLYDLGNFQIATVGNPVTTVMGELWVTYEVCLYKPYLGISVGYTIPTDHWRLGSISNINPLGTTSVLQPGSQIGTTITLGTTLTFPSYITDGYYLILHTVLGNSTSTMIPTVTAAPLALWINDSQTNMSNGSSTTTTTYMYAIIVKITVPSQTVVILSSSGIFPSSPTAGDLWITQLNGNISS